jgi:DNA-binding NarL/FixJ family response regulator
VDGRRPWTVLIVEDDDDTRAFLARCVRSDPRLRLAGEVSTRAEALAWLGETGSPPDALLVDLGLPDGSGLDVIAFAGRTHPDCEAIVVSVFGDETSVIAAIEAGAVGYLCKDLTAEQLADAIVDVRNGGSPISPTIARTLLTRIRATVAPSEAPPTLLSKRETEVLEWLARGYSYAEVADRLQVSLHTVQAHVKNLYGKLAVHSKNAAVFEAMRRGLLAGPMP